MNARRESDTRPKLEGLEPRLQLSAATLSIQEAPIPPIAAIIMSKAAVVTQTVIVKDAATGKAISGATIGVCDACACYIPKKSDSTGKASFGTKGLQTIDVASSGYIPQAITVDQSAATYPISLTRVPTKASNALIAKAKSTIGPNAIGFAVNLRCHKSRDIQPKPDWNCPLVG